MLKARKDKWNSNILETHAMIFQGRAWFDHLKGTLKFWLDKWLLQGMQNQELKTKSKCNDKNTMTKNVRLACADFFWSWRELYNDCTWFEKLHILVFLKVKNDGINYYLINTLKQIFNCLFQFFYIFFIFFFWVCISWVLFSRYGRRWSWAVTHRIFLVFSLQFYVALHDTFHVFQLMLPGLVTGLKQGIYQLKACSGFGWTKASSDAHEASVGHNVELHCGKLAQPPSSIWSNLFWYLKWHCFISFCQYA